MPEDLIMDHAAGVTYLPYRILEWSKMSKRIAHIHEYIYPPLVTSACFIEIPEFAT